MALMCGFGVDPTGAGVNPLPSPPGVVPGLGALHISMACWRGLQPHRE